MVAPRALMTFSTLYQLALELKKTIKLASPLAMTQLGEVVMTTVNAAFIGRIGTEAIAAVALAGRLYLISVTFGAGLILAMPILAAQAFGSSKLSGARSSLRMSLWAALLASFPMTALPLWAEKILLAFGQPPNVARLAEQYLLGLAWGSAPALGFFAIRSFMGAVNRPEPILWITFAAIPFNAGLVYALSYGQLGLPRLELFGAGLATSVVNCATFLAGLWLVTNIPPLRDYHVLAHVWRFDWPAMRELLLIGTPISIASLIEYSLFSAAALAIGLFGTSALAAHQIAVQISALFFIISFGISMAAAVRVSHGFGRNDCGSIQRAALAAVLLGFAVTTILSFGVIVMRYHIARLFLGASALESDSTIKLTAELLLVSSIFFISSSVQSIVAGCLRGLKDTTAPLLFSAVAHWVISPSVSYILGFRIGLGAVGIWIGLSVGTSVCATLLVFRLQLLVNRTVSISEYLTGVRRPC